MALLAERLGNWFNPLVREIGLDRRRHGFEFLQPFGRQSKQAGMPNGRLETQRLPEAHDAPKDLQTLEVHEEPSKRECTDDRSLGRGKHTRGFRFGPCMLEKFSIVHPGRAGCHACQATQAEIHFVGEFSRRFESLVRDRAHQGNAAPWAVTLKFGGVVSGAGWQA